MNHSDKILDLLLKGSNQKLKDQDLEFLKQELEVEEIEDYTELIEAYLAEETDILPRNQVKENLLQHFHEVKGKASKSGSTVIPLFLKISVAAVFFISLGASLYYFSPAEVPLNTAQQSNELMNMEFQEFTEVEKKEEEKMKEETKYLLHVDFFSNSSLIGN